MTSGLARMVRARAQPEGFYEPSTPSGSAALASPRGEVVEHVQPSRELGLEGSKRRHRLLAESPPTMSSARSAASGLNGAVAERCRIARRKIADGSGGSLRIVGFVGDAKLLAGRRGHRASRGCVDRRLRGHGGGRRCSGGRGRAPGSADDERRCGDGDRCTSDAREPGHRCERRPNGDPAERRRRSRRRRRAFRARHRRNPSAIERCADRFDVGPRIGEALVGSREESHPDGLERRRHRETRQAERRGRRRRCDGAQRAPSACRLRRGACPSRARRRRRLKNRGRPAPHRAHLAWLPVRGEPPCPSRSPPGRSSGADRRRHARPSTTASTGTLAARSRSA